MEKECFKLYIENNCMNTYHNNKHLPYPKLVVDDESYMDFTSLQDLLNLPKTNLYRMIKGLENVPTLKYKNRIYFRLDFCTSFWSIISDNAKRKP